VLPSREEAFGLALAESLACGTPVVGTDEGGIAEVIGDANVGRLFAPDDASALAGALREVLTLAEDDSIRDLCRERAEAFSVERSVSAHLSLYGRLIGERPPRSAP
jgi:glycosyltransferase involved in cell wall biosynthesis